MAYSVSKSQVSAKWVIECAILLVSTLFLYHMAIINPLRLLNFDGKIKLLLPPLIDVFMSFVFPNLPILKTEKKYIHVLL